MDTEDRFARLSAPLADEEEVEVESEVPVEEGEEPETPDWLSDLDEPGSPAVEEPLEPTEAAMDTEDWLARLSAPLADEDATEVAEEPAELPAPEEAGEVPEWLSEVQIAPTDEQIVAQPPEDAAVPDWLDEIPTAPSTGELSMPPEMEREEREEPVLSFEEPPTPSAEVGESIPDDETTELPDWLDEIPTAPPTGELSMPPEMEREETEELSEQTESPLIPSAEAEVEEATTEEEEADLPDWLSELRATSEEGGEEKAQELDWPAADETTQADMVAAASAVEIDVTEVPSEMPEPVAAEEAPDVPDWISELQEEEPEQTTEWLAEVSEEAIDERVEPLAGGGEDEIQDLAQESLDQAEAAAEEIPEWLADTAGVDDDGEEDVPDWLAELPSVPAEDEAEESPEWVADAGEEAGTVEAEIPDWLAEATEPEDDEEERKLTGLAAVAAGAGLALAGEEEAEIAPQEEEGAAEEVPEVPIIPEEEERADWLSDLDEETPDWLAEISEAPPVEEETPASQEWLIDTAEPPQVEDSAVPSSEEALAATAPVVEEEMEIPDWLSELRESTDEEEAAPDWLAELTGEGDIEQEAEESDWPVEVGSTQPEPEIDDTPDWLADAVGAGAVDAEAAQPELEAEASDFEEAQAAVAPAEDAQTEVEMPDWLAELPVPSTETEGAETPAWLADTEETEAVDTEVIVSPADEDEESATPPWLAESLEAEEDDEAHSLSGLAGATAVAAGLAAHATPAETTEEAKEVIEPEDDEASGAAEPELPEWLAKLSAPLEEAESVAEPEVEESPAMETPTAPEEPSEVDEESSDWLSELGEDDALDEFPFPLDGEPEAPAWLLDSEEEEAPAVAVERSTAYVEESQDIGVAEPEVETSAPPVEPPESIGEEATAQPVSPGDEPEPEVSPGKTPDEPEKDPPVGKPAEKKSLSAGLESSYSADSDEDLKVAEATGVLAGLSSLLPAQEVTAGASVAALGTATADGQQDAVLAAAREFQTIATHTPEPATLPAPLTRRDHLIRGGMRAGLYLLFIILIAIPLIPGLQRLTETGQAAPWTEPTGALGDVLDKQRREMIGSELGVVDLQQPGSVALVSFDYTPATQGEMQPLAEAVVGRLKGQGMRLIFMSLEPEGASLAQGTLEQILEARGETYGTNMVNLGYLPGQAVAIRELAGGRPFATMQDHTGSGSVFGESQSAGWSGIDNIRQVDMVVTIADNPTTGRWWAEQLAAAVEPDSGERYVLAAASAIADPYLRPYRASEQFDGLISGINGAAAVEAGRNNFGPARQMLDSQSIAHLLIIILIAAGTMVGWMPLIENSD